MAKQGRSICRFVFGELLLLFCLNRNRLHFNSPHGTHRSCAKLFATQCIIGRVSATELFYIAQNQRKVRLPLTSLLCWMPPEVGWAKINTDIGCPMGGTAGAGGTIRDANGRFSFQRKNGHCSVSATELWAL
ncbi:hypothetical protein RHGRI_016108 [Rhododendron griersonianum]|uniref:Secreted protein n=1 Tax=Rhododendron griersonianum TaxID=479676 RepID=A0AAV6JT16_9ERIC|nr:hypothetical protein RHGRI_016108 [Rhododendron griersonianum]